MFLPLLVAAENFDHMPINGLDRKGKKCDPFFGPTMFAIHFLGRMPGKLGYTDLFLSPEKARAIFYE